MKKILSMALSFALLVNTFTTLASADEFEMVGDAAPAYADYVAEGLTDNIIKDPDNLSDFTRSNGTGGKHKDWQSGAYFRWEETNAAPNTYWCGGPSYFATAYNGLTEGIVKDTTYVMSAVLKNDTVATRPTLNFAISIASQVLVDIPVSESEYKKYTAKFVAPKDFGALCVGFNATIDRSGLTNLGILNMDLSNGGSFYVAKEKLHDISVESKTATTVEQRGKLDFSAALVNQIGETYGAQNFKWYVVNTERTEKIASGFTFSSQTANTTLQVAKDVAPGKYVVMAESTADSKFKKGIEIEVTKEILKDNGTITLNIKSEDVKPSYDVFADFTITAGNISASDIKWYAVKENRMDVEDKITITPTTGTSAKVTFVDGLHDGKYYLIAESIADDSKRKMVEITVDNSNVRKTIIADFNSGSSTSWEAKFEKYVVLIGEDSELYSKADKAELLKLIVEQSKVEAFDESNLSNLFKGIVVLSLYNKNTNGVELNKADGTFNYETDLDLLAIDTAGVSVYNLYKTAISEDGKKKVLAELTGKNIKSVKEFKEIFVESVILNAVCYPKVLGFQYVKDILTAENMALAGIDAGKYLLAEDNSGYNKEIARKTLTISQLEAILARTIESVPEEEIYTPGSSEKTEIEIPMGTEGSASVAKSFADLPDSHWAYADVYFLTELGVISGVSEDYFAPDNLVTREVAAKIICKAFNLSATGDKKAFSDVDPNAWYAEYIDIAASAGVINGVSDTKFGVGQPVTREDLCVMITRAIKAELSDVEAIEFDDADSISEYAKKSVSYLYILSVVSGYNDNTFRPQGYCKRSEIAKIISRVLNIIDLSSGSADEELVYPRIEELLFGIGAVETEKYKQNANITRAGLAKFINDVCIRAVHDVDDEWENNVMTDGLGGGNQKLFDDLDESHTNYFDIEVVVKKGYMDGISERVFAPDIQVNLNYVVKTALDIMGYSQIASIAGGYSEGYPELARSLGLLEGVSGDLEAPAKYKDVVRVFANAMDMGVNKVGEIKGKTVVLSSNSQKTFMTEVMKMDVVEGLVTDNGITSLSGKSKIERNYIVVGGHKIKVPEELKKSLDLIGRRVRAYYDCSEEGKKVLVFMVDATDDDYYAFNLQDFVSYDGKTLVYEKNGIDKALTMNAARVIYNGTILDEYDESLFINKNGDVTVLSVYDKNDYIIVNDYKDFVASKVSAETEKVYSSVTYQKGDELKVLNLKVGDEFEEVNIYFSTGEVAKFEDITVDSVLAVKSNKTSGIMDVYIHNEVIHNTQVLSVDEDGVTVAEGEYEVAPSFGNSTMTLDAGKAYNFYLNQFGQIVYAELVEITEGKQMGILTRPINNEDEELYGAKIYDQNKTIVLYTFAERVNVNDKRIKKNEVKALIDAYVGEPILYTVTDGVITDITTPEKPNGADKNRGLYKIIEPIDKDGKPVLADTSSLEASKVSAYKYENWYLYRQAGDGASFGGKFSYDKSKTKVYVVPASKDDYSNPDKFSINVKTFSDHTYHMVDAYAFTQDAVVPDIIIAREEAKKGGRVEPISVFLITAITQGLTEDDMVRNIVQGYKITNKEVTYTELPISEEVVVLSQKKNTPLEIGGKSTVYYDSNTQHYTTVTNDIGNVGPRTFDELDIGDIIRYDLNSDGEIATIAVSFDYEIDDEGHKNDGLSQAFEAEDVQSGTTYGYVMKSDTDGIKILEKYTKTVDGESITLVKGSKPEHTNLSSYDAYSRQYGFITGAGYRVLFIEKTGSGKMTGWLGSVEDVISYKDSNSNYDEMVLLTRYKGGQIAAVVYR